MLRHQGDLHVNLHSLSLQEIENVALVGCSDVQPDAGHQIGEGAAPGNVGAPPNVQPLPQHLEHTEGEKMIILILQPFSSKISKGFSKPDKKTVTDGLGIIHI